MTFDNSTKAEFHLALRELYRSAKGDVAGKIAKYFQTATSAELQSAFAMTVGQVAALNGRITAIVTSYNSMKGQVGE